MDNPVNFLLNIFSTGQYTFPILAAVAFLAGIFASLSPCSLGMLPLIIGYVGGYSKEGGKKLFVQMIFFSLGLSLVLGIIGALCALTGKAFTGFATPVVLLVFASFILILGLNLLGILDISFPTLIKKMPENKSGSAVIFPFTAGCVFALAASPCSSPLLASILALAALSSNLLFAVSLLFSFAFGQCVIIIFFALFTSKLKNISAFAKYTQFLVKLSGLLLIAVAIYIYYTVFVEI